MFESVPLDDPGKIPQAARQRLRRDQRWLLLGILLLMLGMAAVDHLFAPAGESRSLVFVTTMLVVLSLWRALRTSGLQWRGAMLVLAVLFVGAFSAAHHGSVRAAPVMAFIAAVVIAGTYLRLWALVGTTAVGLALLGGLTWAEVQGLLPETSMAADLRFWSMGSAILIVMGLTLINARRVIEEASQRRLGQIEERMRLEQERDRSLRRFQRMFHINPTALVIQVAASRRVKEVNPAFVRLLGYPLDSVPGRGAAEFWADQAAWDRHCQRLFSAGRTGWEHALWLNSDGQPRLLQVSSELLEDAEGELVLTTVMQAPGEALVAGR